MNARNAVLLLLVFGLAVANLLFVRDAVETPAIARLFPDLTADAARRIELSTPDGVAVTLERDFEGVWLLAERGEHPAYAPAVDALLRGLASATDAEREATSPSSHADLGVDASTANRIRVVGEGGAVLADVAQGAPPDGGRGCRLLPAGQDAVYRAATVPRVKTDPSGWIDFDVVPFDASAIRTLDLRLVDRDGVRRVATLDRHENGRFELRFSPKSFAPAAVDPFLQALETLAAADVLVPEVGTPEPDDEAFVLWAELHTQADSGAEATGFLGVRPVEGANAPGAPEGAVAVRFVHRRGGPDGSERVTWFAIPATSDARLRALAGRLLDLVDRE